MIRNATSDDKPALLAIAEAIGFFSPEELQAFSDMMDGHLSIDNDGRDIWIADDQDGLQGAAYYAPEPFAEGVWNLYFIGVRPEQQGKGCGRALIRYVEADLKQKGDRMLLVETSGTDEFAPARSFYQKNGYTQEARIRDYYQAGDDKIIFRKVLSD